MDEETILKKLGIRDFDFRLVIGTTKIDYDPEKETENRRKHGYSLESASDIFGRQVLPIEPIPSMTSDPFMENDEVRHMHMSIDDSGNVVHIVTTMRPDETLRVISLRRASPKECELFEQHTGYKRTSGPW